MCGSTALKKPSSPIHRFVRPLAERGPQESFLSAGVSQLAALPADGFAIAASLALSRSPFSSRYGNAPAGSFEEQERSIDLTSNVKRPAGKAQDLDNILRRPEKKKSSWLCFPFFLVAEFLSRLSKIS